MYPELMVVPMREELVRAGIKETRTAEEVDAALAEPGTTLVVVNSICGCAAGKSRPGIRLALSRTRPTRPIARSLSLPVRIAKRPIAPAAILKAIRPVRPRSPLCATASWCISCSAPLSSSPPHRTLPANCARLRCVLREDYGIAALARLFVWVPDTGQSVESTVRNVISSTTACAIRSRSKGSL